MNPLDNLTINDLSEKDREVADMIGLDAFIKLVKYAGGSILNVPTPNNVSKKRRNSDIAKEYNGYNAHRLAVKYGLTDDAVHKIIRQYKLERIKDQQSLF